MDGKGGPVTPEVRFERVEGILERVALGMQELEAAQLHQEKAHTKLVAVVMDLGVKVDNLTILVDRLVERDLGQSNGGM